jgi:vitamin B12 transporter
MTTLNQALNSLPGISMTRSGGLGTTSSLFVQGFSNKYTLVLIDGVRYSDPTNTSGSDISNILIDDIERIEVIKGAQSGVWGADAAAGVINIITKKAKPGTRASVGVDTGNYLLANTNINYKVDKTWSTYLKVNNMLDKEYQSVYGYATARRSFYLGVKASF